MTTHRRPRFAPAATLLLVLATGLASRDAAADEPLAPRVGAAAPTLPDFEPFEEPTRIASPALVVVGSSLIGVGTAGIVTGAVMTANAPENPGAPDMVSGPALVLGGVLVAAGLPLLLVGVRDRPVESASAVPVIRVGATAADATWRF